MQCAPRAEPLLSESLAAPQRLEAFSDELFGSQQRQAAFERYLGLALQRERPNRYWRVDLDALALHERAIDPHAGSVVVSCEDPRVLLGTPPAVLGSAGAIRSKFGALANAFANRYGFVEIPADIDVEAPILITYAARHGEAIFPYTCIYAHRGARASVIERVEAAAGALACGVTEIVADESSDVTLAAYQHSAADATVVATRSALAGAGAVVTLAGAEIGGALVIAEIDAAVAGGGADIRIAEVFFPADRQHVDVRSTVDHGVGGARSLTTVRSAATGHGQARYIGNIRIAAHAQKSDASLRDDALILSAGAHIDSVPALEIAANDVRAYHGATVGALDAETIFYMTTRGIDPLEAERMVTLGFFETAIEQFPALLREELRAAIEAKVRQR